MIMTERKVLAEKSVIPLLISIFGMLCCALMIFSCVVAFDYSFVAFAVIFFVISVYLLISFFKMPMLIAEFDGEKIILYPSRGKRVELLPEEITNVSVRRGGRGSFFSGAIIVRTKGETYHLSHVSNIYKAENAFLEITDKKNDREEDHAGE